MTSQRPTYRAAFYTGNFHLRDAIGRSIRDKIDALLSRADAEDWQITVFCQSSDVDDPAVIVCASPAQVVFNSAFSEADLHIFEFGWYFELMDVLLFVPTHAKLMAYFHGITPPDLIKDRRGYLSSWKQLFNLHKADMVLCNSRYEHNFAARFGIDRQKLRLLPLPVTVLPRRVPVKAQHGPINLLQVGRLVPSKGIFDLVRAIDLLPLDLRGRVQVKIVGSREAGDQAYLADIDAFIAEQGLNQIVTFTGTIADDTGLSDLYGKADALISPSYHEGYCLPVIEAYAHGCHVIVYDNSNLPHIAAGFGRVVPTGDVEALSAAIAAFVDALKSGRASGSAPIPTDDGAVPWTKLQEKVRRHAEGLTRQAFNNAFLGFVDDAMQPPGVTSDGRLNPALFFEDKRSHIIHPRDLRLKEAYQQPGLRLLRDERIEYDCARFSSVREPQLFFGPYIDLLPGRWRLRLNAEIKGEFILRLTRNFGSLVVEKIVSPGRLSCEFDTPASLEKFETVLIASSASISIVLHEITLDRLDAVS